MANLSIREAVKHYYVSRPTLTKALKSGKVSGTRNGHGVWSIDPSELARVYQPRLPPQHLYEPATPSHHLDNLPTSTPPDQAELQALQIQLAELQLRAATAETRAEAAETLANERAARIEDLRRMLPPPKPAKKRRWWRR